MRLHTPKLFCLLFSLFFLLAALLLSEALFHPKARLQRNSHSEPVSITGEYKLNGDSGYQPFSRVTAFDITKPTTIYLKGRFTKDIEKNQQLVMRINNLRVKLHVNGRLVYSFGEDGTYPGFMHAAGGVLTSFTSPGITKDDLIELTLSNAYTNSLETTFNDFFDSLSIGSEHAVYADLLHRHVADPVISLLCMAIGLIMLLIWVFTRRVLIDGTARYIYLAGFIIATGCWFLSGSPIISLLIPYPAFYEILYPLSIFLITLLFLLYVLSLMKGMRRRILVFEMGCSMAVMVVSMLIQFFGVADLYALLTYILPVIMVAVSTCAAFLVCEAVRHRANVARTDIVSLLILFLGGIMDLLNYFFAFYVFSIGYRAAFLIFAALQLFHMFCVLRDNVEKMQKYMHMEKELLQSRISVMLSQIKPHFLYNVLNDISALCLCDPNKAEEAIETLSSYLSGNIRALEAQNPVPFTQELRHIESFVNIEKIRFGEKLRMVYDIGCTDFEVPTLSLQTLVENAIRHGVTRRPEGGTVTLRTERKGDFVKILVADDGVGFQKDARESGGIGLQNAQLRLQYMMDAEMTVRSEPQRGTAVTIRIPVKREGSK